MIMSIALLTASAGNMIHTLPFRWQQNNNFRAAKRICSRFVDFYFSFHLHVGRALCVRLSDVDCLLVKMFRFWSFCSWAENVKCIPFDSELQSSRSHNSQQSPTIFTILISWQMLFSVRLTHTNTRSLKQTQTMESDVKHQRWKQATL